MNRFRRFLAMGIVLAVPALAKAHDDIVPYAFDGKIYTGAHDDLDENNPDEIEARVFGYDFGENANPYIIGDPGFNNSSSFTAGSFPNDGKLVPNLTLAFYLVTNLEYWDGAGGVSFSGAPAGVQLGLKNGGTQLLVDANGSNNNYPLIGATSATGRVHDHMDETTLNFTDGVNVDPPNAPAGIYLVGMRLRQPGAGVADSDAIYLLFNNELDEATHDVAIDWVNATLVPEPGSVCIALVGAVGLIVAGWRKRRGRTCA